MLEIYSSTHASAMAGMHWKQLMWIGIGIVGMFLISRIDYHTLLDQAPALHRWRCRTSGGYGHWLLAPGRQALDFARRRRNLQVSELMKLIIIIVLARYFSEVRTDRLTLRGLGKVGVLTIFRRY